MEDSIRRYIRARAKLDALMCYLPALPVVLWVLLLSAKTGAGLAGMLWALLPLGLATLAFAVRMHKPYRFMRMIRQQEAQFGVRFGQKRFSQLAAGSSWYCSEDWFVSMRSWAFCRDYVQMVEVEDEQSGKVLVETVDGKTYLLRGLKREELEALSAWARR
ncbi:MAG: hypothetical protein IJ438_02635 [Clostridia bacterium]|nr:hypothetical protein [Clostridia bacterium]